MSKRDNKTVGKVPERRCHFGGLCKFVMISARDPFTGKQISEVACEKCGKPA